MKIAITLKSKSNTTGLKGIIITGFRIERFIAAFKYDKSLQSASYWFYAGYDFSRYESKNGRNHFKIDFNN